MNDDIWDIFQHRPNTVVYTFWAHRTRLAATGQIGINQIHPDTLDRVKHLPNAKNVLN